MKTHPFLVIYLLSGSLLAAGLPEGYEVGEDTRSPDGRYVLLYPEYRAIKTSDLPNLLVQLEPYKELAEIRPGVPKGATMEVITNWSGNSTVAIYQFRKWGIVGLWVYELDGDKKPKVHPVLDEVRKVLRKDFKERVLKKHPKESETITFISSEGEEHPIPEFAFKGRKVVLNLYADNKPNGASGPRWTAMLKADWNLDTGKLENVKIREGEAPPEP